MFSAERGKGAHLNGVPVKSSGCTDIGAALACVSFGVSTLRQLEVTTDETRRAYLKRFQECVLSNVGYLTLNCLDIRHIGSTAMELCYLAAGRLDCLVTFGPKEWDLAAGCLILEEAGAVCSDLRGNQPVSSSSTCSNSSSSSSSSSTCSSTCSNSNRMCSSSNRTCSSSSRSSLTCQVKGY
ncbi:inositol monophosphatase, putative [Eimeria tenella]|uniref:Inositol monophosphatase, putative n=1 Tax=Eimeria tenella TaxID=5802 RepID=U6KGG2_EIMTE|nr:inositol monophosphatase, putative [Eimeria tenella]CDJ37135.1 inositol monophosphatase, putative [Eimeria tenella]|eukprot:XP_013227973.1 inositol monophosphatase, putative [Eimeria tenella]